MVFYLAWSFLVEIDLQPDRPNGETKLNGMQLAMLCNVGESAFI